LFLRFRGDNDAAMSMMDDGAEQSSVVTSNSILGPRTKEITLWFKEESPNPRIHHINLHRREMRNPPPSRFFLFFLINGRVFRSQRHQYSWECIIRLSSSLLMIKCN
jgi:hypothetical protein